jgi:PKD repeat protein
MWDFGDGETADGATVTHVFDALGEFTVVVSATNSTNELYGSTKVTIIDPVLKADFSASPTEGFAPLTVEFTNLSKGDYDTCLWDFGDGETSIDCGDPSHEYMKVGNYSVSLTVKGFLGQGVITRSEYINVIPANETYLPLIEKSNGKETSNSDLIVRTPKNLTPFSWMVFILLIGSPKLFSLIRWFRKD